MIKRRTFLFSSLKAAALLSPVLSIRRAEAQVAAPPLRVFFWVNCQGYPHEEDFFPSSSAADFVLPFISAPLQAVRDQLVIVDGIDIAERGHDNGNNHVRTMGRVLTAKEPLPNPNEEGEGLPGDVSIDQRIAVDLGRSSIEMLVNDRDRGEMRDRPSSLGPQVSKAPYVEPAEAWAHLFGGFVGDAAEPQRQRRLQRKRSLLDGLTGDLRRLRQELSGIEREKLDVHEDALLRMQQSVQRDMDNAPAQCAVPGTPDAGAYIPDRAAADLDVLVAAFACNRVQQATMTWGASGYHWPYQWVPGVDVTDTIHDEVHHREVERRESFRLAARWDWQQIADFALRLRAIPEGTGTLLDNTLIVALSHFGYHHRGERTPVALIGGAQGALQGGRVLRLEPRVDNALLLTSVAGLCGLPLAGFGDLPSCGPLPGL